MASEDLEKLQESNIDFNSIEFLYDYGDIKPEDKKLTSEVLKLVEEGQKNNHNWTKIKRDIETKFEIDPVPVISFEFKSKPPPSCGVVSSKTFNIPVSVSISSAISHLLDVLLYFKILLLASPDVSTSFISAMVFSVAT